MAPDDSLRHHRSSSPVKGRRSISTKSMMNTKFTKLRFQDVDEADVANPLEAVSTAEKLIADKRIVDEDYLDQVEKLPLLDAGQTLKNSEIGVGFRVRDCCSVVYDIDCIKVEKKCDVTYDDAKTRVFVSVWPTGFAWMYWTDATFGFGADRLTLGECAIRFGMGTFVKPNGCKTKEIFLDAQATRDNSFVIAIVNGSRDTNQIMSRQKEQSADVYRVWRSDVPSTIQETIQLRQLINIRQKSGHVRWWEF